MTGGTPDLDRYRGPEYRRLLAAARKSLERTGGDLAGRVSVAQPDDAERKAIEKLWAEVEAMLFEHPAVQEACVIATHDPRRGESVKALIVLRNGEHATEEEIVSWARERMASYKVPRVIQFAASLPRTASGKIQWRLLQEDETRSRNA